MGVSIRRAAKQLGVTHPALLKAAKVGSLRLEADGTVDLDKARQSEWWNNRAGKSSQPAAPLPGPNPEAEKAQKRERLKQLLQIENLELMGADKINLEKLLILERREALRLDNEERRSNLVKVTAVEERWLRISSEVKGRLLILPGVLAGKLVSIGDVQHVRKILEAEIRQTLTVISETTINAA